MIFTNGTYLIDLPQGVDSDFYVVQVENQRGLMVVASSSNFLSNGLDWSVSESSYNHYVDNDVSDMDSNGEVGSHSNFTAQQSGPDSIYDTLTEGLAADTQLTPYYPSSFNLLGSTQHVSGSLTGLQANDGVYMTFRSQASTISASSLYSHQTTTSIGGSSYCDLETAGADQAGNCVIELDGQLQDLERR